MLDGFREHMGPRFANTPRWSSKYMVCYSGRDEPLGRPRILGPALGTGRGSDPCTGNERGPSWDDSLRCSVVTTEEARKLVEVLEDAGAFMQSQAQFSYASRLRAGAMTRSRSRSPPASRTIRVSE